MFKRCTQCKTEKPFAAFRGERRTKIGLQSRCRECESAYARTPARLEACRRREEVKRKDPAHKAYHRDYSKRPGVVARRLATTKAWQAANPERLKFNNDSWREANPDRKARMNADWKRENPGAVTASLAKYRARKLRATPPWADLIAIRAVYMQAAELGLTVDHIVPLQGRSVCGLHVHWNLQLLSRKENAKKNNRLDEGYALAFCAMHEIEVDDGVPA